ncbi:hypothetical protein [Uliginosibacterium sp. 31-12]|uniref:hypothetical protein n=1 Tax=Uliginosibacterium sp. 31-12 TaxID=3062781 RepID=UPI0026E41F5D|nr:hypothetical protein [Uliginosibacterium sp. 31-12]MDO6385589.1 hypothetical protein [Uliginosibacterium sp. 31-12]
MSVCIDTRKAHQVRQHGDITAVYTWVNDERALVLIPTFRKAGWYVVADSAAYLYDDDHYLMRAAIKACEVMGFGESHTTAFSIAKIIHEGLGDLVLMPPEPPDAVEEAVKNLKRIGEMHLKADGEIIGSQDITVGGQANEFQAVPA